MDNIPDKDDLAKLSEGSLLKSIAVLAKPMHLSGADFSTFSDMQKAELQKMDIVNTGLNYSWQLLWKKEEGSEVVVTLQLPGRTQDRHGRPSPVIIHCTISSGDALQDFISKSENNKTKLLKIYSLLAVLVQEKHPELMGLFSLANSKPQDGERTLIQCNDRPFARLSLNSPSSLPAWVSTLNKLISDEVQS